MVKHFPSMYKALFSTTSTDKKTGTWAGETVQWLRVLVAHLKDLSSVPSTGVGVQER